MDSLLAQTFTDWSCAIVIDGPDALAESVARSYSDMDRRIHVIALEKQVGVAAARNIGFRWLGTFWLLPFDADDWMDADFLATLYNNALTCNPLPQTWPVFFTSCRIVFEDGTQQVHRYPAYDPLTIADNLQIPGVCMMPYELFEHLGGYNEDWRYGAEDWMFWVRASAKGVLYPVQSFPAKWNYRQHGGERSHKKADPYIGLLKTHMRRVLAGQQDPFTPLVIPDANGH